MLDKNDLKFAARQVILEQLNADTTMTPHQKGVAAKFIQEQATLEQLLNFSLNPGNSKVMIESDDIVAALEGTIGVLTEGAPGAGNVGFKMAQAQQKADLKAGQAATSTGAMGAVKNVAGMSDATKAKIAQGGFVLAGAAVLSVIAYYIYKNHFSASAKACKGKADFKGCVADFKKKAIQATIAKLKSSKSKCSSAPDKAKCAVKVDKEIAKWEGKLKNA